MSMTFDDQTQLHEISGPRVSKQMLADHTLMMHIRSGALKKVMVITGKENDLMLEVSFLPKGTLEEEPIIYWQDEMILNEENKP